MSIRIQQIITCVCERPLSVHVYRSVNGVRHAHLRQAILDRRFHAYSCPSCDRVFRFDEPFSYVDVERRQLLGAFPEASRSDSRPCAEQVMLAYEMAVKNGPESVAWQADDWLVRVCFGHEELREKLVLDEAGLSDLALEVLKGDLLTTEPWFQASSVATLTLDHIDGDELVFLPVWLASALEGGARPAQQVRAKRSLYDEYEARGEEALLAARPTIASGPHVSLLRLAVG